MPVGESWLLRIILRWLGTFCKLDGRSIVLEAVGKPSLYELCMERTIIGPAGSTTRCLLRRFRDLDDHVKRLKEG
jgi:hypothetical protein